RANDQPRRFGTSNPPLTYTISGFVNGDTIAVVSGVPSLSTTADPGSPVGSYPIAIAAGTLAATNYDFPAANLVAGTLTITAKETPVLTWDNPAAIVYGKPLGATQLNA